MAKLLTYWMGQTALPDHWTSLGRDFKKVEISCKLNDAKVRWCRRKKKGPPTSGYLYFEMSFNHISGPALMRAEVRIAVQSSSKVCVGPVAPERALGPRDPPTRQRSVTNTAELNPRGGGGGFTASLGRLMRHTHTQSSTTQPLFFRSRIRAENEAEFAWGRTMPDDTSGLWREFAGAVIFWKERQDREQHVPDKVTVSVSVVCKIDRCFFARFKSKQPERIQINTTWGRLISDREFENLTMNLQEDILERNEELKGTGELTPLSCCIFRLTNASSVMGLWGLAVLQKQEGAACIGAQIFV